jgi:hypothetical protein
MSWGRRGLNIDNFISKGAVRRRMRRREEKTKEKIVLFTYTRNLQINMQNN